MNPSFVAIYMVLMVIIIQQSNRKKYTLARKIIANRKKGRIKMTELLNAYIDKECTLYTINDSVSGTIKSISDGWVTVDTGKELNTLNLDFVIRVKEKRKKA